MYITILSEHDMPKYIIFIKITLFKKHVQNVVGVAYQQKIMGNA